jgi:uncharacterized protein
LPLPDLLAGIQGVTPEFMHIVPPRPEFPPESYRVADYAAYYRRVRRRAEEAVDLPVDDPAPSAQTYPEPVAHCDICTWWKTCDGKRRADDDLARSVDLQAPDARAGVRNVTTLAALATEPIPLSWKPKRGAKETYERAREQARVQLPAAGPAIRFTSGCRSRRAGSHMLPTPSPGDVFLDLEGDPFAGQGGQEYLSVGRARRRGRADALLPLGAGSLGGTGRVRGVH